MTTAGTMYRLPSVQLFASGVYRGKRWSPAVVRQMADNAGSIRKLLIPPAVLGHEEEQEWLDRTDLPAAGWVDPGSVRVVPDPDNPGELILRGDVVNVPQEVANRLKAGEYGHGSAEIYDDFLDDFGKSHGPALRRFALLGGEVPQVKRLGRLPAPVRMTSPVAFAERRPPPRGRAVVLSFAERTVMQRSDLIKTIQTAMPGLSQATLEVLTDDQLKELVANLPKTQPTGTAGMDRASMIAEMVAAGVPQTDLDVLDDAALQAKYDEWKAGSPAAINPDAAGDVATMGDPAAMSREELIAELTSAGQDAAALESMSDDDLRALYTSIGLGATAEMPAEAAPVAAMGDRTKTNYMGERGRRRPASVAQVAKFAEQAVRGLRRQLHQARVLKVTEFCDRMVRDGRYFPAQLPVLKGYLLSLDDTTPVHRFSDSAGRTVQGSALERAMATVAKGPQIVRFGEKVGANGTAPKTTSEAETRKVERFAESLSDGVLRASGQTREAFVQKFSEAVKRRPGLTAAEYLGPTANVG
jgi:hypothetical protein